MPEIGKRESEKGANKHAGRITGRAANIGNFGKFSEVPDAEEIVVAALLLRNLQLLQFNAHEFFETRQNERHRFRGSRPVYLGVAIYPTVARFNHDCYPAVTR
jgi:hypothetical protein